MNSARKGSSPQLPRLLSARKRATSNPDAIHEFASKQGSPLRTDSAHGDTLLKRKSTLAHLDMDKEKERQKNNLVKKTLTSSSLQTTSSDGTMSLGGNITLNHKKPTLRAVSKATLATTRKANKGVSPSPPKHKKHTKNANDVDSELRLNALYRYDILGTPPEVSFDDIAKLATVVCGTPIAIISLVDKDRQWFKARVGIEPDQEQFQTPIDFSFCTHSLTDLEHVFEVSDATKDERFSANPFVTDDTVSLRFYAGAPLVTADNKALGALCVVDRKARTLTPTQHEALRALASLTVNQLELRARSTQLQQAQDRLQELQKELEAKNEALVARNTHLETQIKELELTKEEVDDIELSAPAQNVISILRGLQTQLDEKLSGTLDKVIGIIGSNKIYEVDVKDAIQKSGTDLDDQTKGFLITQLHTANPAKENSPSRPSSAIITSARQQSIDPYRPVLEGFDRWDYNIFNLALHTGGKPLMCAGFRVLEQHSLLDKLDFPSHKVMKYLQAVEAGYISNPYHNNIHATDVLLGANYLLTASGVIQHLSVNELFSVFFAALIHDLGHPGVNNSYLIQTGHDLAVLHNDRSVLENHHCAQAFKLLQLPENNFIEKLPLVDKQEIRKTVIELVLATDMSQHVEIFNQFQNKRKNEGLDIMGSKPDRLLALKMIIKCADISNPARDFNIYKKWVECIMEEFWQQGDAEKMNGMPISAFMDRFTTNVPKCQSGFIQFICMPIYTAFVEQFPGATVALDTMKSNLAYYKNIIETTPT